MCTFDFFQLANKDTFLFVRNQNALKYEEAIICVMLFIFFIRWRRNYEIDINIFRVKKVAGGFFCTYYCFLNHENFLISFWVWQLILWLVYRCLVSLCFSGTVIHRGVIRLLNLFFNGSLYVAHPTPALPIQSSPSPASCLIQAVQ